MPLGRSNQILPYERSSTENRRTFRRFAKVIVSCWRRCSAFFTHLVRFYEGWKISSNLNEKVDITMITTRANELMGEQKNTYTHIWHCQVQITFRSSGAHQAEHLGIVEARNLNHDYIQWEGTINVHAIVDVNLHRCWITNYRQSACVNGKILSNFIQCRLKKNYSNQKFCWIQPYFYDYNLIKFLFSFRTFS